MRRVCLILCVLLALVVNANAERYQVVVLSNMEESAATTLQRSLQKDGYSPVEVVQKDGKYAVVVGEYSTKEQANAAREDLRTSGGYEPEGIQDADAKTDQKTVSTAEAGTVYRVVVSELDNQPLADEAKKQLVSDDYDANSIDVLAEEGKHRVYYGEFATQDDAKKLIEQLRRDGYSQAEVRAVKKAGSATADSAAIASISPESVQIPDELKNEIKNKDEEQSVRNMLAAQERIRANQGTADDYLTIINENKRMREDLKQVKEAVKSVAIDKQKQTESQRRISALYAEVQEQINNRNWAGAESRLEEIRQIDPSDARLEYKRELVTRMKNEVRGMPSQATQERNNQRITQLIAEARQAQAAKNFDVARNKYNEALTIDPQSNDAKSGLAGIAALASTPSSEGIVASGGTVTGGMSETQKYLLYGGAGLVLLVLMILTFVLILNTRREKELIRQVQELASHTADARPALGGNAFDVNMLPAPATTKAGRKNAGKPQAMGSTAGGLATSPLMGSPMMMDTPMGAESEEEEEVVEAEVEPVATPAAASGSELGPDEEHRHEERPAGEADILFLSGVNDIPSTPLPDIPDFEEQQQPAASGSVDLGDLNIPFGGIEAPPVPPKLELPPAPPSMPEIDFDALLGSSTAEDPNGPVARIEDIAPPPSPLKDPTQPSDPFPQMPFEEMPQIAAMGGGVDLAPPPGSFDVTTALPAVPSAPQGTVSSASTPTGSNNGSYFEQTFEDEPVGEQPKGWQGEYDYATLTVVENPQNNGSAKCLKFEKRSGAGSANYVCHFPKATGRVVIEFDVRCDDKNKYLLGFYIEKDEDFKQSVHTIVHRTDSKSQPSLRIQGEPIPYELGAWRHVKYELNLMVGLVNAFVDDNQIVREGKLPTNPPYVNTLSIRDNLATTGVLYLDNIRIYRG